MGIFLFFIFLFCDLITCLLIKHAYHQNFVFQNGLLLGVHIPKEQVRHPQVETLCGQSKRRWNLYQNIHIILGSLICLISFFSAKWMMLIWIFWFLAYLAGTEILMTIYSIKAARRAGFKFINVQTWFDYIRMLDRMGKDLHNPNLVAPTDLQAAHNEYVAKVERQRIKEQREADRKRAEADEAEFAKLKGKYLGLVMTDGEIIIHTLNSVAEYYEEGSRQHICVGSSSYYLKKDSLVFTAKIGRKTIATIEISLKDYSVIQCRAFANGVCKYTDRISEIIKANTKLIRQRKRARA